MKIRIDNSIAADDVAFVLERYAQLLEEKGIDFKTESKPSVKKDGATIVSLVVSVATWAIGHMAWELLKIAVSRANQKLRTPTKVTVDHTDFDLANLPDTLPSERRDSDKP